jgi:hypothetical protein
VEEDGLILSNADCERIHEAALEVLRDVGVRVDDPETVRQLQEAGASITDENVAHLPRSLVEWAIRQSPKVVRIADRGDHLWDLTPGGATLVVTGNALYITRGRERRDLTSADLADLARIVDACGNVSNVATVYLEVVAQTRMEDVYTTTCIDTPVDFSVTATDLWIHPDDPEAIPFSFGVERPFMYGIVIGDLSDVTYSEHGRTTKQIESARIDLTYIPAEGFIGHDRAVVRFSDPFGGESTASIDVLVSDCSGPHLRKVVLHRGDLLMIVVPVAFAAAYEEGESAWSIEGLPSARISADRDEQSGAYVLTLDGTELPPGKYKVTIPLGDGERVMFDLEVMG